VEPLLATLPWDNLKEISLTCAFIHYHELIQHIEKLSPTTYIAFQEVCLLSGVWVDLLDALRQKADCSSSVVWMRGKEDERLGQTFTYVDEDWEEKWEEDTENPASAYIRGQIAENPLRSIRVPVNVCCQAIAYVKTHSFHGYTGFQECLYDFSVRGAIEVRGNKIEDVLSWPGVIRPHSVT
jgi:hypothetical protein